MGVVSNITKDRFPKQGSYLGKVVEVFFHYDTSISFYADVIRDDIEAPGITIFMLTDGRCVLSTECQYSPVL